MDDLADLVRVSTSIHPFRMSHAAARVSARVGTQLMTVLSLGTAFGAYFVLRYLGYWSEQDTDVFVRIITDMQAFGNLESPGAYTHGYAYPVWATTLADFTGLSVRSLLQLYTPLIGNLFLAVFGYACFRRLLASDRLGLIATSVLFLVPELVFTVSRGNHEKLTVSLTLLALLALVKSFLEWRVPGRWHVFVGWAVVYYLCAFTLATLNVFFGSTFIVAVTLMVFFTAIAVGLRPHKGARFRPLVKRLALVVGINWLLVMLVMWYVYPQTTGTYDVLFSTASERLSSLLFPTPTETESSFSVSDPYAVGSTDWASLNAYRLVSSFRFILFLCSFSTWLVLLVGAWRRLETLTVERLFLLGLYGSLGFVVGLAIPIDFLNLSAGTNLQVRIYTYFALLAAPTAAFGIERLTQVRLPFPKTLLTGLMGLFFCLFGLLSLLKATLDPMVSNRWLFYHPSEVQAARFWDQQYNHSLLWMDVEGRLTYAYFTTYPEAYPDGTVTDNSFDYGAFRGGGTFALHSAILRETAVAWQATPPYLWLEDRPYDNGEAQIYHRTPTTPFQQ